MPKTDPTIKCPTCSGKGHIPDGWRMGEILRAERKAAWVTAKALAAQMGISPAYLCDMEWGRREISPAKVSQYRQALSKLSK